MEGSGCGIPRDRLSELPLSIILHILSLLPIRDVIKTTLLSKRWKNLWTNVPSLNFIKFTDMYYYDEDDELEEEKVRSFVNRALLFWKGSKILKFNFVFNQDFGATALDGDMDLWVRFAVDNDVEELNVNLKYSNRECTYTLPQCLYSCSSMTKLSLEGCNLKIHGTPTWNHLKSLKLAGHVYSEDVINRVMLGSPLLEEFDLRIIDRNEDLYIQSTSLKKLKINKRTYFGPRVPPIGSTLRICCPTLKTLEMSGTLYTDYRLENVSSLSDVTLSFYEYSADAKGSRREPMLKKFRDLVLGLEPVERLTLSAWCYKVLSASGNLPRPLPNVKFIKLSVHDIEHQRLVDFLPCFPNLKILVFEDEGYPLQDCTFVDKPLEAEEGLSTSSLPQLRAVEIHAPIDNPDTFRFIVFLLNHFSMLQKLVISARVAKRYPPLFMVKAAQLLLSLQKSFPTTELILHSKR